MKTCFMAAAAAILVAATCATAASADEFLGSYIARISYNDHQASDGFPLESAAQMVRQDRANWHKFGSGDAETSTTTGSARPPPAPASKSCCTKAAR